MQKKILAADTNAYVHRAWHSSMAFDEAYKGYLTGAMDAIRPTHLIAVKDMPGKTWRHDLYPEYKAQRERKFDLPKFLKRAERLNTQLGFKTIGKDKYEGDDLFGFLVQSKKPEDIIVLLTQDKDIAQLTINPNTYVMKVPTSYEDNFRALNAKRITKEWGVSPHQIPLYLAICGDTSDNIPGIKGIGKVTAKTIVKNCRNIDEIYEKIDDLNLKSRKQLLVKGIGDLDLYLRLTQIKSDFVIFGFNWDDYAINKPIKEEPAEQPQHVTTTAPIEFEALKEMIQLY